jgi:hypothetical protein
MRPAAICCQADDSYSKSSSGVGCVHNDDRDCTRHCFLSFFLFSFHGMPICKLPELLQICRCTWQQARWACVFIPRPRPEASSLESKQHNKQALSVCAHKGLIPKPLARHQDSCAICPPCQPPCEPGISPWPPPLHHLCCAAQPPPPAVRLQPLCRPPLLLRLPMLALASCLHCNTEGWAEGWAPGQSPSRQAGRGRAALVVGAVAGSKVHPSCTQTSPQAVDINVLQPGQDGLHPVCPHGAHLQAVEQCDDNHVCVCACVCVCVWIPINSGTRGSMGVLRRLRHSQYAAAAVWSAGSRACVRMLLPLCRWC